MRLRGVEEETMSVEKSQQPLLPCLSSEGAGGRGQMRVGVSKHRAVATIGLALLRAGSAVQ